MAETVFKRKLYNEILEWKKNRSDKYALLIKGARRVGKSTIAEEFAKNKVYREQYDLCVSRAVSNLATLSEYCLPYVKVGGHFISYKSGTVQEELQQAEKAVKILGGKIQDVVYFNLPDSEIQRSLVVIEKIKTTPGRYPRKAGTPLKEPLA